MRERDEAEQFEEMLGEELRAMVAVEPGEGFRTRLREAVFGVEGSAAQGRPWLWRGWAVGAVAAGVVAGVVLWGGRTTREAPVQKRVVEVARSVRTAPEDGSAWTRAKGLRASRRFVGGRQPLAASSGGGAREPKLATFPAVTQRGDLAHWMGGSAWPAQEVSGTAIRAMAELQEKQAGPLEISRIDIPVITAQTKEENR